MTAPVKADRGDDRCEAKLGYDGAILSKRVFLTGEVSDNAQARCSAAD